jgi:hypothetical protein
MECPSGIFVGFSPTLTAAEAGAGPEGSGAPGRPQVSESQLLEEYHDFDDYFFYEQTAPPNEGF